MKAKILFLLILLSAIVSANSPPELSEAYHTPSWGYPGTNFTFSVTYTDADGDPPTYVRVYIQPPDTDYTEDMGHEMSHVSGSYLEGALYTLEWTATPDYVGNLNYYFEASDGLNRVNKPTYGGTCIPGDCPECCGDFGGPVVFAEPIDDCGIYLFSKNSSTPLWSYETGSDWTDEVAISADGNYIAAQTYGGSVYLFSKDSNNPLWIHNEEPEGLGSVAISSNGSYIAAGSGSTLYLFSPESGTPLWSCPMNSTVSSVSISADGDYITAGNYDNKLFLFSRESSTPLWVYEVIAIGGEGGGADVTAVSISTDGNYIAAGTGCPDRSLYLFSKESNVPLWVRKISTNSPIESISMSADGSYFAVGDGGPDDPTGLYFFGKENNESLWSYVTNGSVNSVSISADGERILAQHDESLYLFPRGRNASLWTHSCGASVISVSISADGNYIASGSTDKRVRLFSNNSNIPIWNYHLDEWVMSVDLSEDGSYIVAGSGASIYLGMESPGNMTYDNATCGDGVCEGNETYENCPADCLECPIGDLDCDGIVSDFELLAYIDLWVQGEVDDFNLLEAIDNWASR